MALAGAPAGSNVADWGVRVTKARARIGESWQNVMAVVRELCNSVDADPAGLWDLDNLLRYVILIFGSDSQDGIGGDLDPGNVYVYAEGSVTQNPSWSFVIIHGQGGTRSGDRFQTAAQQLKACSPTYNVFILDWTAGADKKVYVNVLSYFPYILVSPIPMPGFIEVPAVWASAANIEIAGKAAASRLRTFQAQGVFDPQKATFVTESYGGYVGAVVARELGGTFGLLGFNLANSTFVPQSVKSMSFGGLFRKSVVFPASFPFDNRMSTAHYNVLINTPSMTCDFGCQHNYGMSTVFPNCMAGSCNKAWLELGISLPSSPGRYDAEMFPGDCMPRPTSREPGPDPLYPDLTPLLPPDKSLGIPIVTSFDPNSKQGSEGVGQSRHLAGEEPLRYEILFENLETASAPAQEVVITDQLDAASMELSSISLATISFDNKLVLPAPFSKDFSADVDLRPAKNLFVRIAAGLNAQTGVLSWRFTSLDPATMQRPTDPLAGFLPPNKTPPEGQGSVVFTVMPKVGLATGTQIRNRATIVFDTNPPIQTPEWLNTLDNSKPVSQVAALAAGQAPSFPVQWSGSDEGAGILDYTIYVSDNGGPFSPWLVNTTQTSATFTGACGHTYAFYSVARDQVGNIEAAPASPDATTAVQTCPALAVQPRPMVFSYRLGGSLPGPQPLSVNSTGAAISFTVAATTSSGGTWLSVSPPSGSTPASVTVTANPGTLAAGIYHGTISVASAVSSNSPVMVPVALVVLPATGTLAAPAVVSASPAAGNGLSQIYSFTFSSPYGWQSLGVVNVLINFWLDGRNSCYIAYSRPLGVLYLVNDPGTALSAELYLGTAGSVSNSQCTVYGTGSSASGSGNTLTLTLNIGFKSAYAGTKIIYLAARDLAENNSGWQRLGVWTVPGAAPTSPRRGRDDAAAGQQGGSGHFHLPVHRQRRLAGPGSGQHPGQRVAGRAQRLLPRLQPAAGRAVSGERCGHGPAAGAVSGQWGQREQRAVYHLWRRFVRLRQRQYAHADAEHEPQARLRGQPGLLPGRPRRSRAQLRLASHGHVDGAVRLQPLPVHGSGPAQKSCSHSREMVSTICISAVTPMHLSSPATRSASSSSGLALRTSQANFRNSLA